MARAADAAFGRTLDDLAGRGVSWSIHARDVVTGDVLVSVDADRMLPSASAAKVLVLLRVAEALTRDAALASQPMNRRSVASVGDSGIWQHLASDELPVADVARLVGLASDNRATNVLLHRFGGVEGLPAWEGVRLHDIVRDVRSTRDPETLSTGTGRGYAELFARIAGTGPVESAVRGWLRDGFDLSMVPARFGLDPLAHREPHDGITVLNKTGTDVGTRADAGLIEGPARTVAYGCLARWDERASPGAVRHDVLAAMAEFGMLLRAHARG